MNWSGCIHEGLSVGEWIAGHVDGEVNELKE